MSDDSLNTCVTVHGDVHGHKHCGIMKNDNGCVISFWDDEVM